MPKQFIAHHGVKGMKWGVRNERKKDKSSKKSNKSEIELLNEKVQKMSNAELRESLERIRLQNEYIKVFSPQEKKVLGKKITGKIMDTTGDALYASYKDVIKSIIKSTAKTAIESSLGIKLTYGKSSKT